MPTPKRPKSRSSTPPDAHPVAPASPASAQSARFRRTRQAHISESAEDYCEAVANLTAECGQARIRDLAAMMGVTHVTVSRIITRLTTQGLVARGGVEGLRAHRPVVLTARGNALACRVEERHKTVLAFLLALGVPQQQAEFDAEGIEHHVSEATIAAMHAFAAGTHPAFRAPATSKRPSAPKPAR